jgi:hypothetical protein
MLHRVYSSCHDGPPVKVKRLSATTRVLGAGAAALLAAGGLALFQSASSGAPQSSLPDTFDPVTAEDPIESFDELPLASLSTPDQDRRFRIHQAIEQVAADCMAEQGYEFETLGFDATPTRNRYGLVDVEVAGAHGYADPDGDSAHGDGTFSEDYTHALVGDQEAGGHEVVVASPSGRVIATYFRDGCLWEGEQTVWGDWAAYEADRAILQQVDIAAREEALAAAPVVEAMADWSACMGDAGYDVADQDALYDSLLPEAQGESRSEGPSSAERALATADAQCNLSAGLEAAWYSADVAAQHRLLEGAEVSEAGCGRRPGSRGPGPLARTRCKGTGARPTTTRSTTQSSS